MARCRVCRVDLAGRPESRLDTVCNDLINPRDGKPGAPEGHPEAVTDTRGRWKQTATVRQTVLGLIWRADRSPAPGWGVTDYGRLQRRLNRGADVYYS